MPLTTGCCCLFSIRMIIKLKLCDCSDQGMNMKCCNNCHRHFLHRCFTLKEQMCFSGFYFEASAGSAEFILCGNKLNKIRNAQQWSF